MKKYFILLIGIMLLSSCSERIYQLDKDGNMSMYLRAYLNNYYEQPKNIGFLIKAFDKVDDAAIMRKVYASQYKLLTKFNNKLILYSTDSITAIYYKRISPSNLVTETGYTTEDYDDVNRLRLMYSYYDKDGYIVTSEKLTSELKTGLNEIKKKYDRWLLNDSSMQFTQNPFKIIILQYTKSQGLINLFTKQSIDVNGSGYFPEVERWLRNICEKYGFSKIIIPSPVPDDV